jgi:hypothetical protein
MSSAADERRWTSRDSTNWMEDITSRMMACRGVVLLDVGSREAVNPQLAFA